MSYLKELFLLWNHLFCINLDCLHITTPPVVDVPNPTGVKVDWIQI